MAVILRSGEYGYYFGSTIDSSNSLTIEQMQLNAQYIYKYLLSKGWTINAICGMLGNIQAESSINPGRWQNDDVNNYEGGYGLVQWTPATKYSQWVYSTFVTSGDMSMMDYNLARIIYEVENDLQWIRRTDYDISFAEFTKSTASVEYLSKAFLLCYERPADQSEAVQTFRASLGQAWYTYITGNPNISPPTPNEPTKTNKKKKYNFILFNSNNRRKQWIR